jgi:hypothetical protein
MKALFFELISVFLLVLILSGCSQSNNPTSPTLDPASNPNLPVTELSSADGISEGIGLLGAYSVTVDPVTLTADVVPVRYSAVGESYIVNGLRFFTAFPCTECFAVVGVRADLNTIELVFAMTHPMNAGDPGLPPSGSNRLDLAVFDAALVVLPTTINPTYFTQINRNVIYGLCVNPDGYTRELGEYLARDIVIPYFLIIDDNTDIQSTYNRFDMGAYRESSIFIRNTGSVQNFYVYMTFAYGASSKFTTRLSPKYYNPEFNRKAAWKVTVTPQDHWMDNDFTTFVPITVHVFDWQQYASIYSDPDNYVNAPIDNVYSESNIAVVNLELPGLTSSLHTKAYADSGTGTPTDPRVYTFNIANELHATGGTYTGLVQVVDSRATQAPPPTGNRDFLVMTDDGRTLINAGMTEFATYQTFEASVWIH